MSRRALCRTSPKRLVAKQQDEVVVEERSWTLNKKQCQALILYGFVLGSSGEAYLPELEEIYGDDGET